MARSKIAGKPAESDTGLTRAWRVLQTCAVGNALVAALEGVLALRQGDSPLQVPAAVMQWGLFFLLALIAWGTLQRARWSAWAGGVISLFLGIITTAMLIAGSVQIQSTQIVASGPERVMEPATALLSLGFLGGLGLLRMARR